MRVRARAVASLLSIGLPIVAVLMPAVGGAYALSDVSMTQTSGGATFELVANEEVRYDLFQLEEPDRVVLDVIGADTPIAPVMDGHDPSGWITDTRYSLWRDGPDGSVTRYVIETTDRAEMSAAVEGNKLSLQIGRMSQPAMPQVQVVPFSEEGVVREAAEPEQVLETGPELAAHAPPMHEPEVTFEQEPSTLFEQEPDVAFDAEPVAAFEHEPMIEVLNDSEPLDLAPPMGKTDPSYVIAGVELSSFSRTNPEGGGAPMSLDVQGADIRTVLRSISEFSKINIIPDREVEGPISVRLVDVPWRQALSLVCQSAGLEAVEGKDVIRVATARTLMEEELARESNARKREDLLPLETEIIPVRYATAAELKESVSFVLSQRGKVEADSRTNSLLITDIHERIERIRDMVDDLDTETLQVEIIAKLVDVDATASRQFGISWNADNIHSNAERYSGSIEHNTELVNASTELRFGVIRDFANIDATIQALERENKANIISNPSITTVNNRQARILVGKEVPLIVLDESGNPITELKKVGIELEVTPYINSDDRVTMDLHPEVSDLSSQATVQGGIVFTTTEADTRVMVADGETAVIGGLIRTNESRFEEGVPLLKSIPILGNLFKSSDVRKDRRELLIFITPRIVRGMASSTP